MIVGVESNFVLELTFRQEEADDCRRILTLAERSDILLAIPACALFEPYETLIRRSKAQGSVARELNAVLKQLARTDTYAGLHKTAEYIVHLLDDCDSEQASSLATTIERIVDTATVIPLDSNVIKRSREAQFEYDLPPQDAVVLASILQFLAVQGDERKLFANKNRRDFSTGPVKDQLARYNCKLLTRFGEARDFIEATLAKR